MKLINLPEGATSFVEVIGPQAYKVEMVPGGIKVFDKYGRHYLTSRPFTVGDKVYAGEEWRIRRRFIDKNKYDYLLDKYFDVVALEIEYDLNESPRTRCIISVRHDDVIHLHKTNDHQPADTMPKLFARKIYIVKMCEMKRVDTLSFDFVRGTGPLSHAGDLVWLVTVEILK